VHELRALYLGAIAGARRSIYIENQYFTSHLIHEALRARLAAPATPPLEVVLVLPEKPEALKERIALGMRQARFLRELADAAAAGGHHLGVYYSVDPQPGGDDVPVYMHSKVLSVDDRFLLVGSANTTNRSLGFDTELGLAWEAPDADASIRAVRVALLGEHTGLAADAGAALATLAALPGLVERLDALIAAGTHRLRRTELLDPASADLTQKLLPEGNAFDPEEPELEEMLAAIPPPEQRGLRERLGRMWHYVHARAVEAFRARVARPATPPRDVPPPEPAPRVTSS
jgi:phosphatidylserine/phosphatidylglycerophosphate/cardiolipin synthase-like enzyme